MGVANKRYTDYELRLKTNLPVFRVKESSVRRRYSDFEWLKNELERDSKIVVPPLPSKALKRQMPYVLTMAFTKKASSKIGDRPWRHSSTRLLGIHSPRTRDVCTCSSRRRILTEIMCLARLETPEASLSEVPWRCRHP